MPRVCQTINIKLDSVRCHDNGEQTYILKPLFTVPGLSWSYPTTLSPTEPPQVDSIVLRGPITGTEVVTAAYPNADGTTTTLTFDAFKQQQFEVEILGVTTVDCEEKPLNLQGNINLNVSLGGYQYIWSDTLTGDTATLSANQTFPANTGDDNTVYLTVIAPNRCQARDSVSFNSPRKIIDFKLEDTVVCNGEPVNVSFPPHLQNDPEILGLRWFDGSTSSSITLSDSGYYAVFAETQCTTQSDSFRVDYLPAFNAVDLPEDDLFCPKQPRTFTLSDALTDQLLGWQWPDGSDSTFTPRTHGVYNLQLNTLCKDTLVQFELFENTGRFDIPTAFSPNGDNLNERFRAFAVEDVLYMRIYDRWGKLVRDIASPNRGWDGTYDNGAVAPEGVYIYELEFAESACVEQIERLQAGTVTLVR